MPPVKDLNRYTQNLSQKNNNWKAGGQYPDQANHHQFSHQQFFNQYADKHIQPNTNQYPTAHGQHNHQAYFNHYSGQQPQQQYKIQ